MVKHFLSANSFVRYINSVWRLPQSFNFSFQHLRCIEIKHSQTVSKHLNPNINYYIFNRVVAWLSIFSTKIPIKFKLKKIIQIVSNSSLIDSFGTEIPKHNE